MRKKTNKLISGLIKHRLPGSQLFISIGFFFTGDASSVFLSLNQNNPVAIPFITAVC